MNESIKNTPTCELVDELVKREGVEEVLIGVNETYGIRSETGIGKLSSGPARILIVID